MSRRRRPPKQRCPGCGGTHYAWSETTPCVRCARETQPDAAALADMVRQQRVQRHGLRFTRSQPPAHPTDEIPF